jgi:uracil-DNA glycosylase family 4
MLSSRQQHCLQGIGIRRWRNRSDAGTGAHPTDPIADLAQSAPVADQPMPNAAPVPRQIEQLEPRSEPEVIALDNPQETEPAPVKFEIPALEDWDSIHSAIEACSACELSQNCTRKVPGIGDRQADLLIVGEGPGHDEDLRGEPFVGRSGLLLERMLAAIGLTRERVYITNLVKCRPPNNRDPRAEEAQQCRVYLDAQIKQLAPKVILSVGRVSAQKLLGSKLPVGELIQQMHQLPGTDIPLKVTYHPAYLLRTPSAKAIAWQDLKLLHRLLQ